MVVPRVGEAVDGLRALVEHGAFAHRVLEVKNLIGLRAWIAHDGVLTEAVARDILQAARPAVDQFLEVCTSVFAGVGLGYVAEDGSAAAVELEDGSPPPQGLAGQVPGLYIGRDGLWFQIWPLVRHAPPGRGEEAGRGLVTGAYRERFTDASVSGPFWAEIEDEAEGLIGRADELASAGHRRPRGRLRGP